jgi:hypothetical protein
MAKAVLNWALADLSSTVVAHSPHYPKVEGLNPATATGIEKEIMPYLDQSAAIFCCKLAAWASDMFCNFYFVKNHNLLITQQPPQLEKKNKRGSGVLKF